MTRSTHHSSMDGHFQFATNSSFTAQSDPEDESEGLNPYGFVEQDYSFGVKGKGRDVRILTKIRFFNKVAIFRRSWPSDWIRVLGNEGTGSDNQVL